MFPNLIFLLEALRGEPDLSGLAIAILLLNLISEVSIFRTLSSAVSFLCLPSVMLIKRNCLSSESQRPGYIEKSINLSDTLPFTLLSSAAQQTVSLI